MSRKRANGEGRVKQVKNGKWNGQLMDGYKEDGRRNIVSFTADTKAEVLQMMRNYKEAREQKGDKIVVPTFAEWADRWYIDYETQVAPSTYAGYVYTLNLLKNTFGDRPISAILPMEINSFFNQLLKEKRSYSLISKCRAMLIQIFDAADHNELVARNPARAAKILRKDLIDSIHGGRPKDAFTEEEVETLFKDLPNDFIGNSIRLLLISGLRIQELLALTADDIASDGSSITVTKAVKMVGTKPILGMPKSTKSTRTIPIPQSYRSIALYLREHGGKLFLWESHRIGEPCTIEHFRHHYKLALKKIPVRKLTPHCCRHTYITRLQAKGIPTETIAELVGHALHIGPTGVYLHISPKALAQAVEKLGDEVSENAT